MSTSFFQTAVLVMMALTLFVVSGIFVWIFKMGHRKGTVDRELKDNKIDHIRFEREQTALEQEFHRPVAKNRYQGV